MPTYRTKVGALFAAAAMILAVAGGGAGFAAAQGNGNTGANANAASVSFGNQATDGTTVTVDAATVPDGGFIVIHDESLLEGEVIGSIVGASAYLEPGTAENVTVVLDEPITENATLVAMAHRDTNDNGTYDFVETDGTEDGPYLDNGEPVTDSATVTVEPVTNESFDVSDLSAPESVGSGAPIEVSATVDNPNTVESTQEVVYRFGGEVIERRNVTLGPGASTNVTFAFETDGVSPGTYGHGVFSRDRGAVALLEVTPQQSFAVDDLESPGSAPIGETVTVTATVRNPNAFETTQEVDFRFQGDVVDRRDVTIAANGTETLEFELDTTGTAPGLYIQSVFTRDRGLFALISIEPPGDGEEDVDGGDDAGDSEDGADDTDEDESEDDADDGGDDVDENDDDGDDGDDGESGADAGDEGTDT